VASADAPYTLGDYFDVVRRRWVYLGILIPLAVLVSVYIAYVLPPMYRATGAIMLEGSMIPEDLVRATVGTSIDMLQRNVITEDSLIGLVEELDPYPDREDLSTRAKAQLLTQNVFVRRVDPVTLEPAPFSSAFTVDYLNPNPALTYTVALRLIDMFLDYGRETRAQQASDIHEFLLTQSQDVLAEIAALEAELAEFRAQYGDAMPDAQLRNEAALDRTVREVDNVQQQLRAAQERRQLLELQLTQINPYQFDTEGDWRIELAQLRAELAGARQRYTEDHPTVRRLRRAIDELSVRAETIQEEALAPDNPMYLTVASQLDTVNQEISSLRAIEARARQQIATYESSFQIAPEVERRYRQLERDYATARNRHQQIEVSLREALLGQRVETAEQGGRFILLRAPRRPSAPDSPNRLGIILLGLVLGTALGVGLAALRDSTDPSIRSPRDLAEITDIKPVGAIPVMLNDADRRKRFLAWAVATIVAAVAITIVGSTVAQAFVF
jgi:polysaccharide biosynthesis transport protein